MSKIIEYIKTISLKTFFYLNCHTEETSYNEQNTDKLKITDRSKAFEDFEDLVYQELEILLEAYYKWR